MSLTAAIVEGALHPDGTLKLDQKPDPSPGRVTVILRQELELTSPPEESRFQFTLTARKKMEGAGCHFMDEQEMQAHIGWRGEGDRIDDLSREADQP